MRPVWSISAAAFCRKWILSFLSATAACRGIQAVGRIAELVKEVQMDVKTVKLIVNRAPGEELDAGIREEIEKQNLDLLGVIPAMSLWFMNMTAPASLRCRFHWTARQRKKHESLDVVIMFIKKTG